MANEVNRVYGYIYLAINKVNGKLYVGQTVSSRWSIKIIPIEGRWKNEILDAHSKDRRGDGLRRVERAIIKHGSDKFILKQQDVAHNQEELDEKEKHWIKRFDAMNHEKGYNMTEGGEGGRLSPEVIEKLRKIGEELAKDPEWRKKVSNGVTEKYKNDPEYKEKQTQERRERAKNSEWIDKMTEVNQAIARNPEYLKNMSEAISNKWKEQQFQENVSEGATNKWQESKHRGRQFTAKKDGKREILNKREFLNDIQDMKKKDVNEKYDMDGKSLNVRIEEMLGHHGI